MREKIVEVDGKKVGFRTSAAVPILYNREFIDKDFFLNMNIIFEAYQKGNENDMYKAVTLVQEMAYVFAKHYAEMHGEPFDYDLIHWLDQFETFSVISITESIMGLWAEETAVKSTPKKKPKKQTEK